MRLPAGEGDGIVQQAVHHAGEHRFVGIRHQPDGAAVGVDGDAARRGPRQESVARQPQHAARIHRGAAQVVAAGRDLGQVHDLVDDLEQIAAALMDQPGIFADLRRAHACRPGSSSGRKSPEWRSAAS